MRNDKLLSEIVRNDYTELSHDAQGLLKGGFGSVHTGQAIDGFVQNNCACNGNNCDCPNSGCTGVYNNCVCGGNNCDCNTTGGPTSPASTSIPSGLLSM